MQILNKYEQSKPVRRLIYWILLVIALFPLSPVIVAIIEATNR